MWKLSMILHNLSYRVDLFCLYQHTQYIIISIASYPKHVTFGLGHAITFAIGTAIGMVDHNQALLITISNPIVNVNIHTYFFILQPKF